jgi:predicted phosphodiesterase
MRTYSGSPENPTPASKSTASSSNSTSTDFKIAANHFDNIAGPIARSGIYQLVCFGHNHRFSLERFGETVALNPGTLMGTAFGPAGAEPVPVTFATFDTKTGQPALYRLSAGVIELSTWERPNA